MNCENKLENSEDDELADILNMLGMIHPNTMISLDETQYLHLGELAQACIKHLQSMNQTIQDLKSNHVDTRH